MPYATVHAVTHREHDSDLGVDVLAGYGYRASAPSGWRGPFRRRYSEAALDAYEFNRRQRSGDAGAALEGAEDAPSARETGV